MKYVAILTALGLACATLVAVAGSEGHDGHGAMAERLKQADTNGDGMISREEAKALPRIAAHFDEIDANHDGQVTADELRAFHQKHGAKRSGAMLKKLDTDGDGRISRAEAQAAPRFAANFDAIDANKDGFITMEEMAAAHAKRTPK
ncbi:MAG TPA: EF-hand domain-containing protein [Usitatibacter sp.]